MPEPDEFEFLVDEGLLAANHLQIFHVADSAQEAWDHICAFHAIAFE